MSTHITENKPKVTKLLQLVPAPEALLTLLSLVLVTDLNAEIEQDEAHGDDQEGLAEQVGGKARGQPEEDAHDIGEDEDGACVDGEGANRPRLLDEGILGIVGDEGRYGDN